MRKSGKSFFLTMQLPTWSQPSRQFSLSHFPTPSRFFKKCKVQSLNFWKFIKIRVDMVFPFLILWSKTQNLEDFNISNKRWNSCLLQPQSCTTPPPMMVNQDFCEQYHSQKTTGSFLLCSFPDTVSQVVIPPSTNLFLIWALCIFVCGVF